MVSRASDSDAPWHNVLLAAGTDATSIVPSCTGMTRSLDKLEMTHEGGRLKVVWLSSGPGRRSRMARAGMILTWQSGRGKPDPLPRKPTIAARAPKNAKGANNANVRRWGDWRGYWSRAYAPLPLTP